MGLRFMTAGESHGRALVAIVDGIPAGLPLLSEHIDQDLARRQGGHGRGGRMTIEYDRARIISGVRLGRTLGSPISIIIENRDHVNWSEVMSVEQVGGQPPLRETRPRPGHGDLGGMLKYGFEDARDVLERASARETAARTAAGAVAKRLLKQIGVTVAGRVISIGPVAAHRTDPVADSFARADSDSVRCSDAESSRRMVEAIDEAAAEGNSLGGVFEIAAFNLPPGLGSAAQADRRLDGLLCGAIASIPGVKGVEVGMGFAMALRRGSDTHDVILYESGRGIRRRTNNAGGLEAGMTNGETLLLRAAMKPIPTLGRPLATVDVDTLEPTVAFKERADACAVPAASVVGEAVVALVLADAVTDKFGGDCMMDVEHAVCVYLERIERFWKRRI